MFCTKCGNSVPDGTKFCTKCGNLITPPPTAPGAPMNQAQPMMQGAPMNQAQPMAQGAPFNNGANPISGAVGTVMSNPKVSALDRKGLIRYGAVILLVFIAFLMLSFGKLYHFYVPSYYGFDILEDAIDDWEDEMDDLGLNISFPFNRNHSLGDIKELLSYGGIFGSSLGSGFAGLVFIVFTLPYLLSLALLLIPLIPGVKLKTVYMWHYRVATFWNIIWLLVLRFGWGDFCRLSIWGWVYIIVCIGAFVMTFIAGKQISAINKAEKMAMKAAAAPYAVNPQQNQFINR